MAKCTTGAATSKTRLKKCWANDPVPSTNKLQRKWERHSNLKYWKRLKKLIAICGPHTDPESDELFLKIDIWEKWAFE